MAGLIFFTWKLTVSWATPELSGAQALIKTQKAELQSLSNRLETSQSRLKLSEKEIQVLRQANQLLRSEESNRQAELNILKGELDFYQKLAGTSGSQSGLAVYHLELTSTGSERVFRFVLTLTQNLQRSAITSGKVLIDLEGTLDDRPLTLPWSQITDGSEAEPAFRFKYFQQLDGYLVLPPGFSPSQLLVSLEVKGQKKLVSRGFEWLELTQPANQHHKLPPQEPVPELELELELEQELNQSSP